MDGFGLSLLVAAGGSIGLLLCRRRRQQRLRTTHHNVRCPISGAQATLAVATDPVARSCEQYVEVQSCSLLSDVAIGLPERSVYLCDGPPCKVRLDTARVSPLYTGQVSCPQRCVFVLNATAVSATSEPVRCTSGISDAIGLAEQAIGSARMSRLLWYSSL